MIRSKLPHVGTTIFTVMTNRARELGAINLAQGFPDYDAPAKLKDLVAYHVAAGHNQYAPMIGVPQLREQIALKLGASYGRLLDSESEITITLGATEGIFSADAWRSCIRATKSSCSILRTIPTRLPCCSRAGGRSTFRSSRRVSRSIGSACGSRCPPRTRLVILNTPHNPTATDRDALRISTCSPRSAATDAGDGARRRGLRAHGLRRRAAREHRRASRAVRARRRGVLVRQDHARDRLARRLHRRAGGDHARDSPRASVQHLQHRRAAAACDRRFPARRSPEHNSQLSAFYQRKRDRFLDCLRNSSFSWTPAAGTYFQLLDFSAVSHAERRRVRRHAAARGGRRLDSDLAVLRERRRSSACCASASRRTIRRWRKRRSGCAGSEGASMSRETARHAGAGRSGLARPRGESRAASSSCCTPLAGQTDLVVLPEMFTTGFTMAAGASGGARRRTDRRVAACDGCAARRRRSPAAS